MEAKLTLKFKHFYKEPAFKCLALFDGSNYAHFNIERIETKEGYDVNAYDGEECSATGRIDDELILTLELDEERSSIDLNVFDMIISETTVPVLYCNMGNFIVNANLHFEYDEVVRDMAITTNTFGGKNNHSDYIDQPIEDDMVDEDESVSNLLDGKGSVLLKGKKNTRLV